MESTFKKPSLIQALTPIIALVILLMISVISIWEDDSLGGANQMALLFGTAIAVIDGYARSSERILEILFVETKKNNVKEKKKKRAYVSTILTLSIISFIIGYLFVYNKNTSLTISNLLSKSFGDSGKDNTINGFKFLVDIATTISFIVAPIIAIMNFSLVQEKYVGKYFTPPKWKIILSYAGIIFLSGFSILFLISKFF